MTNTNIYNGKFNANEPYAEELIIYMSLYNESLYLSNKKYREIAKQKFAELKKEYEESGLLDDINALLKKSKSKTFRYSKYESEKNVGKSLNEAQYNSKLNRGKGYDVLSWILLDIAEWGEKVIHKDCTIEDGHGGIIFRGRLYEYYIRTRYTDNLTSFDVKYDAWEDLCNDYMASGFHDKGTPIEIQQLLHKKELWELIEVADWFIGEQNIIELKPTRELVNWAERNYMYESKKIVRKSLKEMFDDDEGIVYDFVDFLIYDCGYDEKTVEKYFYKKYKLNGLDTIPTKLYIKIKNEIEDVLGYNNIM